MTESVDEDTPRPTPSAPRRRAAVPLVIALPLVAAALVAGYLLGRPVQPIDSSADAGFLRDMSVHHSQAVDMSLIVLEEADDQVMRTVATDILRTQQEQIGRMQGWLVQWDLPARGARPAMEWMAGHGHHGSAEDMPDRMPGMATEADLEDLRAAEGEDAEILYLQLMIEHHEGGIEMAEAGADLAGEQMVADFAAGMAEAQQSEIDLMEDMLRERGA
ncbi:DUF305 domain-containing protein [Streptomonospora nanhaiensis]|uniref:Uncharacterized protein (DUF305 family) n=1 Tax=Streptomonospora nanhaiensis TaxID=1323731 RepID=A0A853BU66_9ACTN|nr:DUF305 domain-containing protein [Streptomonospora nanhaiensis]MBV2362596.1 DUF305 domain-containing protein [Streptomonospora nanhaiensis]MBX9386875.1 DUF305 domain-containing protein [Streptomonospora nanhaiensis]NYI98057.1 uncharacterized protein (DUF305 family) [Streptomonospora nanhaiensis]